MHPRELFDLSTEAHKTLERRQRWFADLRAQYVGFQEPSLRRTFTPEAIVAQQKELAAKARADLRKDETDLQPRIRRALGLRDSMTRLRGEIRNVNFGPTLPPLEAYSTSDKIAAQNRDLSAAIIGELRRDRLERQVARMSPGAMKEALREGERTRDLPLLAAIDAELKIKAGDEKSAAEFIGVKMEFDRIAEGWEESEGDAANIAAAFGILERTDLFLTGARQFIETGGAVDAIDQAAAIERYKGKTGPEINDLVRGRIEEQAALRAKGARLAAKAIERGIVVEEVTQTPDSPLVRVEPGSAA